MIKKCHVLYTSFLNGSFPQLGRFSSGLCFLLLTALLSSYTASCTVDPCHSNPYQHGNCLSTSSSQCDTCYFGLYLQEKTLCACDNRLPKSGFHCQSRKSRIGMRCLRNFSQRTYNANEVVFKLTLRDSELFCPWPTNWTHPAGSGLYHRALTTNPELFEASHTYNDVMTVNCCLIIKEALQRRINNTWQKREVLASTLCRRLNKEMQAVTENISRDKTKYHTAGRVLFVQCTTRLILMEVIQVVHKAMGATQLLSLRTVGMNEVNTLSAIIARMMVPGERPLLTNTSSVTFYTRSDFPNRARHKKRLLFVSSSGHLGWLEIPPVNELTRAANSDIVVVQGFHTSENIYRRISSATHAKLSDGTSGILNDTIEVTVVSSGTQVDVHNLHTPVRYSLPLPRHERELPCITIPSCGHRQAHEQMKFFITEVRMLRTSFIVTMSVDVMPSNELLLVIKANSHPTLDDFFGGRYISDTAQLVELNFRPGDFTPVVDTLHAMGMRYIVCNNGSVSLFVFPTDVEPPPTLYLGMWAGEASLCELCKEKHTSGEACMFCLNEPQQCDKESNVTIRFDTNAVECVYWEDTMKRWQSDGCEVSPETTATNVVCECNHLSEFSTIYSTENVLTLTNSSTTSQPSIEGSTIWIEYLIILLWIMFIASLVVAKLKDRKHRQEVAVTLATDSVWDAGYFYVVTVLTGWKEWAGTSSSVGIRISGEAGGGATHVLHGHPQEYFLRGGEDWFLLAERSCLGDLKELDVWHSCTGNQPFWYLNQMTIRDVQTNTVWHFVCDKWLADSENVRQTLHVSTSIAFSYNFALMFMQKMFDTQMLFSLFSRSINSTFTSVERVSCGVTAITMAVLVNSVVYKQSGNMIAKRSFSTKQSSVMYAIGDAAVGILSAVITIPLCYLLENTFRRARRTFHGRCIGEHFLVLLPTKTTSTKHIKEEEDKSFGGNVENQHSVNPKSVLPPQSEIERANVQPLVRSASETPASESSEAILQTASLETLTFCTTSSSSELLRLTSSSSETLRSTSSSLGTLRLTSSSTGTLRSTSSSTGTLRSTSSSTGTLQSMSSSTGTLRLTSSPTGTLQSTSSSTGTLQPTSSSTGTSVAGLKESAPLVPNSQDTPQSIELQNMSSGQTAAPVPASETFRASLQTTMPVDALEKEEESYLTRRWPPWCVYIAWASIVFINVLTSIHLKYLSYEGNGKLMAEKITIFTGVTTMVQEFVAKPALLTLRALIDIVQYKQHVSPVTEYRSFIRPGSDGTHRMCVKFVDAEPKPEDYTPPSEMFVERVMARLEKRRGMWTIVTDIGIYIMFTVLLLTISLVQRHPSTFDLTDVVQNMFVKATFTDGTTFKDVRTPNDMWEYFEKTMLPCLYHDNTLFTADKTNIILGALRIRQVRKSRDNCKFSEKTKQVMNTTCIREYSLLRQDKGCYNVSWGHTLNHTAMYQTPWVYQHSNSILPPFHTNHHTYGSGGYVLDIRMGDNVTLEKLQDLQRLQWVDDYTAVVLVELTVYNQAFHLASVVILAFEYLDVGVIEPYDRVLTTTPYFRVGVQWGVKGIVVVICQVLYMGFIVWKTHSSWRTLWEKRTDRAYLTNLWTYVDWSHIILSYAAMSITYVHQNEARHIMNMVLRSPTEFHSFYGVVQLEFVLTYLIAILLSLSFLHVLKLLNFNKHVFLVTVTLSRSVKPLVNYVVFMVFSCTIFLGLSLLVLGPWCADYSTATSAMANLFGLCLLELGFDQKECPQVARVTGPVFFVVIGSTFLMLWIPLIRAVLDCARLETKANLHLLQGQFDLIDFIQLKLKRCIGILGSAEYERQFHDAEEKELARRLKDNRRRESVLLNEVLSTLEKKHHSTRRSIRLSGLRDRQLPKSNVYNVHNLTSMLPHLRDVGHRESLLHHLRDDSPNKSMLPNQRAGYLESLLQRLHDDRPRESTISNLRSGHRESLLQRLRDERPSESVTKSTNWATPYPAWPSTKR